MDKRFIIFNCSEISKVNFEEVPETAPNTLRKSVDGTKTFIEFDGNNKPSFIATLNSIYQECSYAEIIEVLNTIEWKSEIT